MKNVGRKEIIWDNMSLKQKEKDLGKEESHRSALLMASNPSGTEKVAFGKAGLPC